MVEFDSGRQGIDGHDDSIEIPDRTRRALEEPLTVVDLDGTPVEDADATVVLVVSHSGESYRVDARAGVCECPDSRHRDPDGGGCKHVRRARAALDREPLDARVVAAVDVDETLGANAPGPSVVASDGGSAEFTERADDLADDVEDLEERYDDAEIVDADEPDEWDGPHREFDRYGRPTGEEYLRCPDCGVEVLEQHVDRVTHADGCEFEETDDEEVTGTDTPRRSEPADFGGGESTGVQDL